MFNSKTKITWLVIILFVCLLTGCAAKSTPPGANSISGVAEGARYSYHYWDEGLALLFWYDFSSGGEGCVGSGLAEDPVYRLECDVDALTGQQVKWLAKTTDGVSADLWIDGRQYDLANGTMFLIATRGDSLQIEQVARDFSQLAPDAAELADLATEDPSVSGFIARMTDDAAE